MLGHPSFPFLLCSRVLANMGFHMLGVAVLLGGATALLPVYARDILDAGPRGLGLLRSAPAVGALATSVSLARYPLRRRIGPALFRTVIVFGTATIVFGLSTSFTLSLVALAALGASDVAAW